MAEDAIRVWPGLPYPLGATWDGAGTNFALFSAHAEKVELCLFDDAGEQRDRARRAARVHPRDLARLSARRAPAAALWLPRVRAVRPEGRAPLQPPQAAARSLRQGAAGDAALGRRDVRLPGRRSQGRTCRSTSATARPSCPNAGWSIPRSPGGATVWPSGRGMRPSFTRCTSGASPCSTRTCRRRRAAPSAACRARRWSNTCATSASPRSSCCRCTPSSTTAI